MLGSLGYLMVHSQPERQDSWNLGNMRIRKWGRPSSKNIIPGPSPLPLTCGYYGRRPALCIHGGGYLATCLRAGGEEKYLLCAAILLHRHLF